MRLIVRKIQLYTIEKAPYQYKNIINWKNVTNTVSKLLFQLYYRFNLNSYLFQMKKPQLIKHNAIQPTQ